MIGGGGINLRRFDIERFQVFKKSLLVFRGEFAQRQPGGARIADGLVVHIGQVHHLPDGISEILQRAPQKVLEHIGAEIADMGEIVDRGAAGVHAHQFGVDRLERNDFAVHCVEKLQIHEKLRFLNIRPASAHAPV